MKIILKKDVQGLGYKDDVLTVKDGYGRNYLLPQGYAVIASVSALKRLKEDLKQRAHKIAKIKEEAEKKGKTFEGVSLIIPVKVSETGTVYGSVGPVQIAEALAEKGLNVESKLVNLKPVKTLGDHVAVLQLHKEVAVEVPFKVIPDTPVEEEKKEEEPKAAEKTEEEVMEEEIEEALEGPDTEEA